MKVSIGPPRFRWSSYVHEHYMDKKHGRGWEESTTHFEWLLEKIEDGLQWVYNYTINLYLDRRNTQKIKVRIDKYDTWSMDHTLAPIILPMLKQLKETKHGAPNVYMEDVPKELRATKKQLDAYGKTGETDDNYFKRWDWVLDEMIWAFEQKCRNDWMEDYYYNKWDLEGVGVHQERMNNGFRLFGKYFENLWD